MNDCTFDPEKHEYGIRGRIVPGVTKVLNELLPGWKASEFFLGKGRAVHAAAAFVANGIAFEHDPRIAGQVEAVRKFFREIKPRVRFVERQVYSERYLYGGTLDLDCDIEDRFLIVDYKAQITKATIYQCAAYALASSPEVNYGMGVELHADGTYKCSEVWNLRRPKQEWLSLLTTYRIRERLGLVTKEEDA